MKNIKAERDLSLDFVRVCEPAAIESPKTMGQGDRKYSDHVAVEAMREVMDTVPMRGRIVIGEGERDEAPMLACGEKVGAGGPPIDIPLDPLEGTTITAKGGENALAVIALAEPGGFLRAPDVYMDKIAIGPHLPEGLVDLDNRVAVNLRNMNSRSLQITIIFLVLGGILALALAVSLAPPPDNLAQC